MVYLNHSWEAHKPRSLRLYYVLETLDHVQPSFSAHPCCLRHMLVGQHLFFRLNFKSIAAHEHFEWVFHFSASLFDQLHQFW
jgi:hypothetical protein